MHAPALRQVFRWPARSRRESPVLDEKDLRPQGGPDRVRRDDRQTQTQATRILQAGGTAMTLTMYDCIPSDIPHIPDSPEAVGGYVNGLFAWSTADWDRFPHAHHLTISVNAQTRARCLDVETGDATPQQAPAWLLSHADRSSGLPVIYCDASTLTAVLDAMNAARISRTSYLLWSAHYRNEHICGPKTCGFPQA